MGLAKAKALLEVKPGASFLDLIARQVTHLRSTTGSHVRFILMNSFSTATDTRAFLTAAGHGDLVSEPDAELLQNKSPKLEAASLAPISWPADPDLEWCPPGHGDVYPSLLGSGLLDRLLAAGVDTLFVSNADNLGATLDLPLIKNAKTVDPRDPASPAVYQLETAMGSAIELFDGAAAVVVPRTRCAPVKTTSDLFVLRSDAYRVTEGSTVEPTVSPLPKVNLDAKAYKLVDDYEALVPAPPSLVGAKSVTVKGAVRFAPGTVLKGDVLIVNEGKAVVDLPAGEYADAVVPLGAEAKVEAAA